MDESNTRLLEAIKHYQDSLEKHSKTGNTEKLLHAINKLSRLPIQMCHLEETGVGRTVNALKKNDGKVADSSRILVDKWKAMVKVREDEEKAQANANKPINVSDEIHEKISENVIKQRDCDKRDTQNSDKYKSSVSSQSKVRHQDQKRRSRSRDRYHNSKRTHHDSSSSDDSDSDEKHKHKKHKSAKEVKSSHRSPRDSSESSSNSSSSNSSSDSSSSDRNSLKKKKSREHSSSESSKSEESSRDSSGDRNRKHASSKQSHSKHTSSDSSENSDYRSKDKKRSKERNDEKRKENKGSSRNHKYQREHSSKEKHSSKHKDSNEDSKKDKSSKVSEYSRSKESKNKSSHEGREKESHKSSSDKSKNSGSDKREESKSHSHKSNKERDNHNKSSSKHSSSRSEKDHKKEDVISSKDKKRTAESLTETTSSKKRKVSPEKVSSPTKTKETKYKESSDNKKERKEKSESDKKRKKESSSKSSTSKDGNVKDQSAMPKLKSSSEKLVNGIGSESGTSFADALGMLEPPVYSKSKKKPNGLSQDKAKVTIEKTQKIEKQSSTSTSTSPSSNPGTSKAETFDAPKLLKELNLEPLDINISSLLPSITPNYKPIGTGYPVDMLPRKNLTDDEALTRVITAKHQRTKVYSGNKSVYTKVPSLFDMCSRVIQDNIDSLEYTGGVPYSIMKPILEKATPQQLYQLEFYNPYLIVDTDGLWELHCQKAFRNEKPEELETWREMYIRRLEERENRLKVLAKCIKNAHDMPVPSRQTKLAYVDSVVKPPRNIAKKQAKNGTAVQVKKPSTTPSDRLKQLAKSGDASQVAVPNPVRAAVNRSSGSHHTANMKPKKAPLMAKSLSLLKNRFGRR